MFKVQFTDLAWTDFGNRTFNLHASDLEFFVLVRILFHSFGPIKDSVSTPYFLVHGMLRLHLD